MGLRQAVLKFILPVILITVGLLSYFFEGFLFLIPKPVSQVETISEVISTKGESYQRKSIDTLWLPVKEGAEISQGDFIRTESDGVVRVSLSVARKATDLDNGMEILEDSYVRIYRSGNKFHINIKSGLVKTDFREEQEVEIENGHLSKEIKIPEGITEIKFEKNNSIAIKNEFLNKGSTEDSELEGKQHFKGKDQFAAYPRSGSYLFFQKQKSIRIFTKKKCEIQCTFTLFLNGIEYLSLSFEVGTIPEIIFNYSETKFGEVRWELKDKEIIESHFWIYPINHKSFQESLKLGKLIEILN